MYPLISCIMPTANRPEYIKSAIDSFLSQSYENKELLILDDGKQPSLDITQYGGQGNIKYQYDGPIRKSIPKKLNLLCSWAAGEIIARFDDDDYSAPERLSTQYKVIKEGPLFTGFHSFLFYVEKTKKIYKYFTSRHFSSGASFMFSKMLWEENKFDELKILGSDITFLNKHQKHLVAINGEKLLVARIHAKTSATKTLEEWNGYIELDKNVLPEGFLSLLEEKIAA